jgi:hypothetical protein
MKYLPAQSLPSQHHHFSQSPELHHQLYYHPPVGYIPVYEVELVHVLINL